MVSFRPCGGSPAYVTLLSRAVAVAGVVLLASAILTSAARAASPTTSLISLSSTAVKSNAFSAQPTVTPDGRYVAFYSTATNLVSPPFPSPVGNVYLRDRDRATTTLVGPTGSGGSGFARVSADGRWVVFISSAATLPGANAASAVYLWDRETGMSRRLSSNTGSGQVYEGIHEVDISEDGSRVVYSAFDNDAGPRDDTFLVELPSGTVRRLGEPSPGVQPTAGVGSPRISGDGHWATYSTAEKLESADTNGLADIYRENLDTRAKQRVSVTSDGGLASNGSFFAEPDRDACVIAFSSSATNMAPGATEAGTHTFVRDACQNTTEVVSIGNDSKAGTTSDVPQISDDGCTISFRTASPILSPAPTGSAIGLRDRCAGVTSRVDVSTAGEPDNGVVGPGGFSMAGGKGRYVAFASTATNLAPGDGDAEQDIFLRDRANNVGPTVAVATTQSANRVSVDLSGSRDPDGFQLTGATSFGDGSPELPGLVVSHDYAHAGTYTIAVTVTDADGASSRDYRTVTVTDPPPSGSGGGVVGPGGGGAGRGGAGALKVSAKLSRARFAVAPAHGKASGGQGATLTATLSAPATLTLTFERQRHGHRNKGKCVAGRGKPRCTLNERVGSLTKAVGAGTSQIALTGRLGSKALPPGPYRLLIEAKAAGDSAKTTLSFTVTKGGAR